VGAGDEPAGGTKRLSEGADEDVRGDARRCRETSSSGTEDSEGVGLVDDKDRAGLCRGAGELRQGGSIAVHAEERLRHDEPAPVRTGRSKEPAGSPGVAVGEDRHGRPGEPAPVDQARMVEGV
jgi:hypothetical protein